MLARIKNFVKTYQSDIILVIGVILISLLSFAMGYIIAKTYDKPPLEFQKSSYYRGGDSRIVFGLEIS